MKRYPCKYNHTECSRVSGGACSDELERERKENQFRRLEKKTDQAYRDIKRAGEVILSSLDDDDYDDCYASCSEIRKAITLIRNTRVVLDALNVDVHRL
jgi:hypothetical protein